MKKMTEEKRADVEATCSVYPFRGFSFARIFFVFPSDLICRDVFASCGGGCCVVDGGFVSLIEKRKDCDYDCGYCCCSYETCTSTRAFCSRERNKTATETAIFLRDFRVFRIARTEFLEGVRRICVR